MSLEGKEVVFVLGGPGSGKGTQCGKLVEEFGFVHLSAGDLLRAEVASGSENGEMIAGMIKEGKIVPKEVTIGLLKTAMEKEEEAKMFLIDGFPRAMDQCLKFEETVKEGKFCLFFECDEATLEARLLKRGETSGRSDDNIESIRKRFHTFVEQTMPVKAHYEEKGNLKLIHSAKPIDEVYAEVKALFA